MESKTFGDRWSLGLNLIFLIENISKPYKIEVEREQMGKYERFRHSKI
jgi:hypothetical protein